MNVWRRFLYTWVVRGYGWLRIPLLGFIKPRIIELNEQRTEICVPLCWRTRNHLRSMYFGALATGADIACGLIAFKLIHEKYPQITMVFKDFEAKFLKRATSDVFFVCEDGPEVVALLERAMESMKREEALTTVKAVTRGANGDETVAEFKLTISLKRRANS